MYPQCVPWSRRAGVWTLLDVGWVLTARSSFPSVVLLQCESAPEWFASWQKVLGSYALDEPQMPPQPDVGVDLDSGPAGD